MFLAEFYSKVLYVHTCSNFQQIKFFFKSDICECIFLDRNASPNINDLYIWVQSLHTLQNCCNRGGNTLFKYMNMFPSLLPQFGSVFFSSIEGDLLVLLTI